MISNSTRPDLSKYITEYTTLRLATPAAVGGEPVDHKVAVVSTDWLAADRVATELMGFDFDKVGYLTFSARAGLGEGELARIEVLGERVPDHIRKMLSFPA